MTQLVAHFIPDGDGKFVCLCSHHGAWRYRTSSLTEQDLEGARKSLKRHASRMTTVSLTFIGCMPGQVL